VIGVIALALAALSAADEGRLVKGDVLLTFDRDPGGASGKLEGWIDIPASPELVWRTMNDCDSAPKFVPNLLSCRIISKDPGGLWDIREHIANPSFLLPNIRSRFRADYEPTRQIRFAQIEGDFEVMQGQWTLTPLAAGTGTRLRYEARVKPSLWAPDFVVREILESDAPATLRALRAEVVKRRDAVPKRPD
jgi:ribosome-associated toxin RatA of RatAB toxin-antitoxin module